MKANYLEVMLGKWNVCKIRDYIFNAITSCFIA